MIYFIRSYNQFIKIGYSHSPEDRMCSLQTGSPIKLKIQAVMEGDRKTEQGLHELFSKLRQRNSEWFRYTEELKWFIRTVNEYPHIKNIRDLYQVSVQNRLKSKAKRMGKDHKLSKRLGSLISSESGLAHCSKDRA